MRMRSSLSERLYLIVNIIMILIYLSIGAILFFWQTPLVMDSTRKVFSGVLILYATYRLFSLINKTKKGADEN